jgi:hypothetical protein
MCRQADLVAGLLNKVPGPARWLLKHTSASSRGLPEQVFVRGVVRPDISVTKALQVCAGVSNS